MKKTKQLWIAAFVLLCGQTLFAQDLTGDWQGTLDVEELKLKFRIVNHIEKGEGASWKAMLYSIDQSPDRGVGVPVDSVTVKDSSVQFAAAAEDVNYDGKIAADGNSMVGIWSRHGNKRPLTLTRATPETLFPHDSSHTVQFVTVENGVKVEVLDWGGKGRTLLLVAGLGNTAHAYDAFAAKLTGQYHVVGVTRRGFGASSAPATGYGADRLGDDVQAVMAALKLDRPVLVGHSLGGEELSSVGSRQPGKVAGLVYLDAAYSYAFYAPGIAQTPEEPATLPPGILGAILGGTQRYTQLPVPVLAIYALPHAGQKPDPTADAKVEALAKALEQGVPTARVVRIPNANHFVFSSHEADVLREMDTFIAGLK